LEKKLKTYMQKRAALTPDELKDAVVSAYMTAIIAHYTEAMAPAADAGAKKKADWLKWTTDMEESAIAAAKAAGAAKPDDKAVKAAFKKLDESCAKCHAVFRD
jgi:cytochrome c556